MARTSKKSADTVFVYAKLPHGQAFALPDGREITLRGCPVSALHGANGLPLAGDCGVTELPAEDWEEIDRLYGSMRIFASGLVFAAPSREAGDAMAEERAALTHGLEPLDPDTGLTQPAARPEA